MEKVQKKAVTKLKDLNRVYVLSEVGGQSKIHNNIEENGTGVVAVASTYEKIFELAKIFADNLVMKGFKFSEVQDHKGMAKYEYGEERTYLKLEVLKCDVMPRVY